MPPFRKTSKAEESAPRSQSALNEEVLNFQEDLEKAGTAGHIKQAHAALNALKELLTVHSAAQSHAAILRDNATNAIAGSKDPTWESVLNRVIFSLSVSNKLAKAEVEKLRLLLGAALSSGAGALSVKAELKMLCYVCIELSDHKRTPPRVDKNSAHPECIGALFQLMSARPYLLARLSPRRRRRLLESCIEWITGGLGDEAMDGGDGRARPAGADAGGHGPDASVAATPQLMVQYAQLFNQLVVAWVADMAVLERSDKDDGPFLIVSDFITQFCERPPPFWKKMLNLIWSAMLHAILTHGANALHEIAVFGQIDAVFNKVHDEWHNDRGSALSDTFASYVRVQISCMRLCSIEMPRLHATKLSRLMLNELLHASAFKRASALLHAADVAEETWRARSLLQLITDVLVVHRRAQSSTHQAPSSWTSGADGTHTVPPPSMEGTQPPPAKRPRTAANAPLDELLTQAISNPEAPEALCRWLLLAGSVAERHPAALDAATRSLLVSGFLGCMPTAEALVGAWDRMPLLAWCLGNLAAIEPVGSHSDAWAHAWESLHALAAIHAPSLGAALVRGGRGGVDAPGHDARSGGDGSSGRAAAAAASSGGQSGGVTASERLCFVDLAARCLRLLVVRLVHQQ